MVLPHWHSIQVWISVIMSWLKFLFNRFIFSFVFLLIFNTVFFFCGTSSLFLTAFFGSGCVGLSLDLELSEVIDFFFRNVKEFLWIF
jgi:hypothetical protein